MNNSPKLIPESVWQCIQGLQKHDAIVRTAGATHTGVNELKFSIERDVDGFMLVSFYQDDCWMLQRPDGSWIECFVADDKCKGYEESLKKSGKTLVLSVTTKSVGAVNVFV